MKHFERRKLIAYRWWSDSYAEIKPEHVEALEEAADIRISEMMAQGFTSGTLADNIHMTDADPEDGAEYAGWWEVTNQEMP